MEEQATRLRRLKVQAAVKLLAQFFFVCTAGWMPSSVYPWVYLLAGDVVATRRRSPSRGFACPSSRPALETCVCSRHTSFAVAEASRLQSTLPRNTLNLRDGSV